MPDMATLQKMVAQEKAKQQGGGHGGYLPKTCRPCPPSFNKGSFNMGSCSTKIEEADSDDDMCRTRIENAMVMNVAAQSSVFLSAGSHSSTYPLRLSF